MLGKAAMRFTRLSLPTRPLQIRSYTSTSPSILVRTSKHSLPVYLPLLPINATLTSFQTRSYAKSKPKRPFQQSSPQQSTGNSSPPQPPVEPTTIPAASRAAAATERASDGTQLLGELPDISKLQAEYDEIARGNHGGLRDGFTAIHSTSHFATDPAESQGQDLDQQQSTRPLPDLTQGIPSTLDAEMAESSAKSDPESLNITEDPSAAGGKGGGDLPKSAYISSFERRRNRFANYFYAFTLFAAISGTIALGRNWETEQEEQEHLEAPNGWGFGLFYNRASARLAGMLDYYNEPAFPKLLPNTDPAWERPYTLVLSLEDMLVHSEWDREHGWRMAKRPGVDYFLRYLSQYYELVIFTSVPSMIGQPIISKLDPYHIVMWPLFREATRYKNGEYIKDLSFLNRPLNKIILLDTNPAHAKLQPENAIITKKWKGDTKDKELVSFIPFLEYVASMEFNDTREVLKSFQDTHIPTEFAKREAVAREKFMEQLAAEKSKGRGGRSIGGLGSLFGMKPQAGGMDGTEQSLSEGFAQGKTFQDQVRERGQKAYQMLEKEIRENGEKWLKEMAEEEKKMNEEAMKGMKNSITGVFPFGAPQGNTSTSPAGPPSSSS